MRPSFDVLWRHYPTVMDPCDGGWNDQCAIRMSIALEAAGISLAAYDEPVCAHHHARGAQSLGDWLWRNHLRRPELFRNGKIAKAVCRDKQGIIVFKDCFKRRGETQMRGDHIDLWRRSVTKTWNDPLDRSRQVYFWELR